MKTQFFSLLIMSTEESSSSSTSSLASIKLKKNYVMLSFSYSITTKKMKWKSFLCCEYFFYIFIHKHFSDDAVLLSKKCLLLFNTEHDALTTRLFWWYAILHAGGVVDATWNKHELMRWRSVSLPACLRKTNEWIKVVCTVSFFFKLEKQLHGVLTHMTCAVLIHVPFEIHKLKCTTEMYNTYNNNQKNNNKKVLLEKNNKSRSMQARARVTRHTQGHFLFYFWFFSDYMPQSNFKRAFCTSTLITSHAHVCVCVCMNMFKRTTFRYLSLIYVDICHVLRL